jgi:hypothetical protein
MGLEFRDYDGDLRPDILVTNYWFENSNLYKNLGGGSFSDFSFASGMGQPSLERVGWGTGFRDFDNDGRLDCYVANGHVLLHPEEATPRATARQSDQLFLNVGNGNFRDVSKDAGAWFRERHMARGAAFGDVDNDGDIDVLVAHNNDAPALLINQQSSKNNWLELKLVGSKSNRDGIGAKVFVTVDGKRVCDEVRSGYSYASANDIRVHFGLGRAKQATVEVRWPSGKRHTLGPTKANQILTVMEP